jgi:hypothetical protein
VKPLSAAEIQELLPYLDDGKRKELMDLLARDTALWRPLPGPQSAAYRSEAHVVGYGGAAGGGKSDLMIGAALNRHRRSQLFRREYTQMKGIVQRMTEIMGSRDGYNSQEKLWRLPDGRSIEFGSVPTLGDELNYQGRPKDLLGIDEATNFLQPQVRFLKGWVRSTTPGQQQQTILTFNPPTTAEGRWVVDYFAPWLDNSHPVPALPGELRHFAIINGDDFEVADDREFVFVNGDFRYDFDPADYTGERATLIIKPESRTFIASRVTDNPFLVNTGYMRQLQAMPEPLRSQMLYGDFKAGMEDDPWQVIPTDWVDAAMQRWSERDRKPTMDSLGVDVARGGKDRTVISRRHGHWYDTLLEYPGAQTPTGSETAGLVVAATRDRAPVHIDIIGVGASPFDFLVAAGLHAVGVNVGEAAVSTDKSGRLRFSNQRSALWWRFREMLDPDSNLAVALPRNEELRRELCAPKWLVRSGVIYVESREELIKRVGRSPDLASAVLLASMDTPKSNSFGQELVRQRRAYDPLAAFSDRRSHNPFGEGQRRV